MANAVYVIALKRDKRAAAPQDWIDTVRGTRGVTIIGSANPGRLQVQATAEGLVALQKALADFAHIEPVILHKRS